MYKRQPTTNTNLKNTDFDVFAFTADGTAFMGKNDTEFEHDLSLIHISTKTKIILFASLGIFVLVVLAVTLARTGKGDNREEDGSVNTSLRAQQQSDFTLDDMMNTTIMLSSGFVVIRRYSSVSLGN